MNWDLVTWLRLQIDLDEQWALAASAPPSIYSAKEAAKIAANGVHWVWGLGSNWEHYTPDPLEEYLGEYEEYDSGPTLITREEFPTRSLGHSHPLAHSVLSYVEEVRTVDAAHIVNWDPARVLAEVKAKREILETCVTYDGLIETCAWHAIVWQLVSPYSSRPGYRPEWNADD